MRNYDPSERSNEQGAALILALVFLVSLGLIIGAIATLSTGAFTTSINIGQERAIEANAESAATLAIDNVRYSYAAIPSTAILTSTNTNPTPANCMPTGTPSYQGLVADCSLVTADPSSGTSRVVQFYVCPTSAPLSSIFDGSNQPQAVCSGQSLFAVITFDDVPPNSVGATANICPGSVPPLNLTCGIAMTVDTWDVTHADN